MARARAAAVGANRRGSAGFVRARSCRVSWLVQAVAVAKAAALVAQGCGSKGSMKTGERRR